MRAAQNLPSSLRANCNIRWAADFALMPKSRPPHTMALPLETYLRTFRKRHSLTQSELALLLGRSGPTSVSRLEAGQSAPSFECALVCEVVFSAPAHQLFPGHLRRVEAITRKRCRNLLSEVRERRTSAERARKDAFLASLVARLSD